MQELTKLFSSIACVEFGAVVEIEVLEALAKESISHDFFQYIECDCLRVKVVL